MTADAGVFAGILTLQRVARFVEKAGIPVAPSYSACANGSRYFSRKRLRVNDLVCLVSSICKFQYSGLKNPETRKAARANIVPSKNNGDDAPALIVFDIQIKERDFIFRDLFFIPRKVFFEAYPSGSAYIPLEPQKKATNETGIDWEEWRGEKGLRLCMALQKQGAL